MGDGAGIEQCGERALDRTVWGRVVDRIVQQEWMLYRSVRG